MARYKQGLGRNPTSCDTPVQVPQQRDVEWGRELAVALGPACYSLLVRNEGQPEALVAAQGLLEGGTLAQASCISTRVCVCVCQGREGVEGCMPLQGPSETEQGREGRRGVWRGACR